MFKDRLTRADLHSLVENQLLYDCNLEARPLSALARELPAAAAKSLAMTVGLGAGLTWSASLFAFRRASVANRDTVTALPALALFGGADFFASYALTKALGRAAPTRGVAAAAGAAAGGAVAYALGGRSLRPAAAGAAAGALFGYARHAASSALGFALY